MTDFGPDLGPILTAYPAEDLTGTLTIALKDYQQLYTSEKEKHAHVTYFFNGGYAEPIVGEDRIIFESPKVKLYSLTPKMSIDKITAKVLKALPDYDFITINLCNADMIGHTGDIKACIKACAITDQNLGKITKAVAKIGGTIVLTADHGNAEKMLDLNTGEMYTQHTNNPVPLIIIEAKKINRNLKEGKLADVAPTILKLMKVQQPKEMTGKPLF